MQLINKAEEYLLQVQQLISNVEIAAIQSEVVKAIERGTIALKQMQQEISLGYVEKLMDTNSSLQEEVRDIADMLAGTNPEDSDIIEEFNRLEEQIMVEKLSTVPIVPMISPIADDPNLIQVTDTTIPVPKETTPIVQ